MIDATEVALADLAKDNLRPYLARSNLIAVVGDFTGPILLAAVAAAGLSWRFAFGLAAGLMAVYAVMLAAAPLPPPGTSDDDEDTPWRLLIAAVTHPGVWALGVIGALLNVFDEPFFAFVIAFAERATDVSTAGAILTTIPGVAGGVLTFAVLEPRVREKSDWSMIVAGAATISLGAAVVLPVPGWEDWRSRPCSSASASASPGWACST